MFPIASSSNGARPTRPLARSLAVLLLALGFGLVGCERSENSVAGHDHDHAEDHDHDHDHAEGDDHTHEAGMAHDHHDDHHDDHGDDHSHGEVTELGQTNVGPFTVRVNRSGEFGPGADVVVDLWIETGPTTGAGGPAAVRAWIGTEDAAGTVRTRLSSPSPADATVAWHEHLEAPAELGDDPQLWIEIEMEDRTRHRGSIAAVPGK